MFSKFNQLVGLVDHSLVVDKDVNRPFGTGSEVDDGEGLRDLGVLRETMDSRTVVQTVGNTVIDAKAGSSQERDSLVCAGAVGGRVGPGPPGEWVSVRSVRVGTFAWWRGSGDGLGHWVSGQLGLKIQERRILVEEATVARVRRKLGPLFVADEVGKRGSLAFPALAVTNGMLLSLLFFVAVTTEGAGIRRSFRPRASLLGMVAPRKVIEEEAELPGGAFGSSLGAREPRSGKHVETLAD